MCNFFFQETATLSRKIVQKVSKIVIYTLWGHRVQFSMFGKGRHVDHAHSRSKKIANEWLPCTNVWEMQVVPYIDIESENQNSGFNVFLVPAHSACQYKSCGLKWSQKSQTLHYLTFFFQGIATLSTKILCQKLIHTGAIQCNFSICDRI